MSTTFILNAKSGVEAKPFTALPEDLPTEINGHPVRYFWKEMLRVGQYRHPIHRDWKLSVTAERLDKWISNFHAARASAGFKPFVPIRHQDFDATANLGWIIDMKREGDSLLGLHQMIGRDAALAAARNESSVCIRPFRDKTGAEYDELLEHNALVPDPVATGLEPFVALSAGEAQTPVAVYQLSASEPDLADKLRQILGGGLTEEQLLDQVCQLSGQLQASRSALSEAENRVVELSRTVARQSPESPEVLRERSLRIEERLTSLVQSGRLSPAYAQRVRRVVVQLPDGSPIAVALSRQAGAEDCLAGQVIDLLKDFEPAPALGESTGPQVLALARAIPGQESIDPDNALIAHARRMYRREDDRGEERRPRTSSY